MRPKPIVVSDTPFKFFCTVDHFNVGVSGICSVLEPASTGQCWNWLGLNPELGQMLHGWGRWHYTRYWCRQMQLQEVMHINHHLDTGVVMWAENNSHWADITVGEGEELAFSKLTQRYVNVTVVVQTCTVLKVMNILLNQNQIRSNYQLTHSVATRLMESTACLKADILNTAVAQH